MCALKFVIKEGLSGGTASNWHFLSAQNKSILHEGAEVPHKLGASLSFILLVVC